MNLKELDIPTRLSWDLSPAPRDRVPDYARICREIVDLKFLSLDLTDTEAPLGSACTRILEQIRDKHIAVSLTLSAAAFNDAAAALLSDLNVRTALISVSSARELRAAAEAVKKRRETTVPLGVSCTVGRENHGDIAEMLSLCLKLGIERLVFPMQRLVNREECFYFDEDARGKIAASAKGENLDGIKLTIHDPFLWRAFYPFSAFPGGGCQAANSMVYISPDGGVYPCPSLPVKLGDLRQRTLKEMLLSPQKKDLRKVLAQPPTGCSDCGEADSCLGGCRGRSFALHRIFSEPDPSCGRGHFASSASP